MAFDRNDRSPGMLQLNIDPSSIAKKAHIAEGLNLDKFYAESIKAVNTKLVEDDSINKMKIKGEFDRVHTYYNKALGDKQLYKNKDELEKKRDEYNNALDEVYAKMGETSLTSKSRTQLEEYNKTTSYTLEVQSEYLEKGQDFIDQQAEINREIVTSFDGALANAYDGVNGTTLMNENLLTADSIISSQISNKNMTKQEGQQAFTESLATSSLINVVTAMKSGIINSNKSPEQKLLELNNIKKTFNNKFIDQLAGATAEGYENTSKDALEVEMNKQLDKVLSLVSKDMNHITTDRNLRKQIEAEKKEKMLSIQQQENVNNLISAGAVFEAYKAERDWLRLPSEYESKADFFEVNNKKIFGTEIRFADASQGLVPDNQLSAGAGELVQAVNNDLYGSLNLPKDTPIEEAIIRGYEKSIDIATRDLGLDPTREQDRIMGAKFLAGTTIYGGQMAPAGFDYNTLMRVASPESVEISESRARENMVRIGDIKKTVDTANVIGSLASMGTDTKSELNNRNKSILQATQSGLILPQKVIDGKGSSLISSSNFDYPYFWQDETSSLRTITAGAVDRIIQKNGINTTKEQRNEIGKYTLHELRSSDALRTKLEAEAIAIYSRKTPDFYSDGNYTKGVTYDKLLESGALREATERITEDIISSSEDYNKFINGKNLMYGNQPKKIRK